MTEEGLLGLRAHPALSAESPVPFSFASVIEFADFSFALIAFCVTSKDFFFFLTTHLLPENTAILKGCESKVTAKVFLLPLSFEFYFFIV